MSKLRPISIERDYVNTAFSSVLYSSGDTKVLVTTSIGDRVPNWLIGKNQGWVTAEYSMLPGSSSQRVSRSAYDKGRAKEISRLIGRSLRTIIDLEKIEGLVITVDCDVIQADGGTRTAAINGAWVALKDTFDKLIVNKNIKDNPLLGQIAAVSVGIVQKEVVLDLDYSQDSEADVDLNVVMTSDKEFIEIQGTGERKSFSQKELEEMIKTASDGIDEILDRQMKEFS
ncbi:MAG: ribonuclease PH [Actinomycetota bacterium]|nr:ribonuclease PH [Actinomycetota bacterium]